MKFAMSMPLSAHPFAVSLVTACFVSLIFIAWPPPAKVEPELSPEEAACQDDAFSYGYMVRRPRDPHGLEYCEHIARGVPSRFVPDTPAFLHMPIKPKRKRHAHARRGSNP